jgi:hypothetical protein
MAAGVADRVDAAGFNIGWGSCFVDSRTTPPMNEATVVSVGVGDSRSRLPAACVVDHTMVSRCSSMR